MADIAELTQRLQGPEGMGGVSPPLQTALFPGAMALVPAALVTLTSFTRIIIVLSFVRRAVTSQDIPSNLVLIGLSLYLTLFTMGPTLEKMNDRALTPYLDKKIGPVQALREA